MSGTLGTFGNSPAAKTLAKILSTETDQKNFSKVSKQFCNYQRMLHELSRLDTRVKFGISRLVYDNTRKLCKAHSETYRTYLLNIVAASYRKWLVENNSTIPCKFRDKYGNN